AGVKTKAMVLGLVICCVATVAGLGIEVNLGVIGGYGAFGHVNELVVAFEADNNLSIPELHTEWGLRCDIPVWSPTESARVGLGIMGLGARTSSRDLVISSSLIGLNGSVDYQIGQLIAGIDLGAYRGTFSFPAGRIDDLSGWGVGIMGRVGYKGFTVGPFSLGATLSLQWLPIQEMTDASGQRYRGRGTAFLDFSGIAVSIDLGWQSR
ncbi:hypothetical protein KAH43_05080, partial [Candidatus Bipolaricaulota bacterium]|nr:hypothetical protein [Candidatus Bipolaricaulota bacterium]